MNVKRSQCFRACLKCRKSHSGCDTKRPCSRCINSGMAHLCTDGNIPPQSNSTAQKKKFLNIQRVRNQRRVDILTIHHNGNINNRPSDATEWEELFKELFGVPDVDPDRFDDFRLPSPAPGTTFVPKTSPLGQ